MNKFDLKNIRNYIHDTENGRHIFMDNRLITSGGSNIDEIDVDCEAFLEIVKPVKKE